jgi:hypothetical protein
LTGVPCVVEALEFRDDGQFNGVRNTHRLLFHGGGTSNRAVSYRSSSPTFNCLKLWAKSAMADQHPYKMTRLPEVIECATQLPVVKSTHPFYSAITREGWMGGVGCGELKQGFF